MAAIQVMSQQVMTQQLNDWQSDHREKASNRVCSYEKGVVKE